MSHEVRLSFPDELVELLAERVAARLGLGAAPAPEAEPWIGAPAAAEHIGASRQRIYDLVSAGKMPHRKEGQRLLFRRSELDRWLEEG